MKKHYFLTPALLCLLSFSAKCQINLGTAANFILYTTAGAITNTGISQVTGDVGTNTGAVTGFGNVNGIMQTPANGATAQAATDLQNAYMQINAAIPTGTPAPLLGNGQILFAGVYHIAGVTSLAGELTLDAQGISSAEFIFQIDQAFSTDFGAKVKLINGAQACNVFWRTEGLADFAAQTSFKGNLIAHNAAIAMNAADTIEGRMFSIAGAITLDGVLAGTPTGCGAAVPAGPAAANLGSAACFAVLSGNGPVTNTGITYATGDIGTNVGLTTGYVPLFVAGAVHPIPDGITSAAATDLLTAYGTLNTLPADIELLYPAQFGNGLVLTPHTYLLNAATALTNNITLDALGNSNAVFVIKMNGALSTSTNARVILANGANAQNVYWLAEGAINISGNSVLSGTFIANNGAMSLAGGDSLTGRFFTTNGAITTDASVITNPAPCAMVVPVTWLYFNGAAAGRANVLKWATTNETGNRYFTVEKSADSRIFQTLAQVQSTGIQNGGSQSYGCRDENPYRTTYYRLSQTDADGRVSIYTTIKVLSDKAGLNVIQFVQGNNINVMISGAAPGNAVIELLDISGRLMTRKAITIANTNTAELLTKPAHAGMYILRITGADYNYSTKMIIQ